jgi:hypothetical protein
MADEFSAVDRRKNLKCMLWVETCIVWTVAYSASPTNLVVGDSDLA